MKQSPANIMARADRLMASRTVGEKLSALLEPDVVEWFDAVEQSYVQRIAAAAATSDVEALRTAGLTLKCWQELRGFIRSKAHGVAYSTQKLTELSKQRENMNV